MTHEHLTETQFSSLDLAPEIMQGIEKTGFSLCTPIQAATLPIALEGKDVAGQAQTGTGKTAAFLLAVMNHLITHPVDKAKQRHHPRALILAPTRELAIQIHKDAMGLSEFTDLRLGLAYGGTGYEEQRQVLMEGVDILIGTPGRIIDYFKKELSL